MNELVKTLKQTKVFYIATIDDKTPRVRPFGTVTEFEGNAYICCGNFKDVYKQICRDPKVEICGMLTQDSWVRVTATLVEDDRIEAQNAVLDDPTGPKGLYTAGDGRLACFKLTDVSAKIFSFFAAPVDIIQ